jgi:cell division protein DivIC
LNSRRLLFSAFVLLFSVLAVVVTLFFIQTRQEYVRLQAINLENKRHLTEAAAHLQEQETILRRLQTDPSYVEIIIRSRLGYGKPNELNFIFDP